MALSKDVTDDTLQARIDNLVPNKCCTLVYTLGFEFLCNNFHAVIENFLQRG